MGVFEGHEETDSRWYEPEMRLRFVFKSQSNPDGRDGWMIDNVRAGVSLCSGGVAEGTIPGLTVFPVPADDHITLEQKAGIGKATMVEMRTSDGTLAKRRPWHGAGTMTLGTSDIPSGMYVLRVLGAAQYPVTKVIIQH
jgi:hypothetical protein